jgi:hypothetical protein
MAKARDTTVGTTEENPRGDAPGVKEAGERKAFEAAGEGASTHDSEREDVTGAATAKPGDPKVETAVRALQQRVMQTMPSEAVAGFVFAPAEGHALYELETENIPDGMYRVQGSDWILTVEDGKFKSAERAMPPEFGGPDVVSVRA